MLKPPSQENALLIRNFFREAGYDHEQFRRNPLLRDLPSRRAGNLPYLLEGTREPSALNLLLRCFFLGAACDNGALASVIPEPVLASLVASGMLAAEGDLLLPSVMMTPCDDDLFAADMAARVESPQVSDMVLWPNPSTRLLQLFTTRTWSESTLDLGAGCGILAILAAPHSRQVVATDLNPRAAEFTAFNAALNEIDNVECLTGDTFAPVAGRRFDLIMANPPFFVTPSQGQMYCENDMELDGYCRRVVREAAEHLNDGGRLQMLCEWVGVKGQPWQERVAAWFEDIGCDAWVMRSYVRDAAGYARERIKEENAAQRARKFDEWMEYYRLLGVEEIYGGLVAMRKRSAPNWLRIEETGPLDLQAPAGESVLEMFACQDALETHRAVPELMTLKPRLAPDAELSQQSRVTSGKWTPVTMKLSRTSGLPSNLALDPTVAGFLAGCDGSRTLDQLVRELASKVKVPEEQVAQQCCAVVRKLLERRLILV
jgi:methylase of polypeptide subunit release factors